MSNCCVIECKNCNGLENKEYCINNIQYTEEEFFKTLKTIK